MCENSVVFEQLHYVHFLIIMTKIVLGKLKGTRNVISVVVRGQDFDRCLLS